jgi:PPOX class probable F420-dependent enzyme
MPTLSPEAARDRFLSARVARLATVSAAGDPHLVPITFAALGDDVLVSAVDHKPKTTTALVRLDNIAANPAVSVLVDVYDDDWAQLWWARADGRAEVIGPEHPSAVREAAVARLIQRYAQYGEHPPDGVLIRISVARWSGWSAQASRVRSR